jgi:hypothetical protein
MATPYFFLSYATENDDDQLRQFFKELDNDVANLPGGPSTKAGFIDSDQTRGCEWDRNLQDALATTRVMVCIYSPKYFQKVYCGMEVAIMLRRRRRFQDKNKNAQPSNIIPVLWYPVENLATEQTTIARTLPKFFVSRDRRSVYEREGLKYMMETAAHREEYVRLRRSIARDIVIAANRFELEHEPRPFELTAVPNAFLPRPLTLHPRSLDRTTFGPKSTTCVYVGRHGWHVDEAVPFRPPAEDAVPYICAAVAERLESSAYEMAIDPGSAAGFDILDHIARNNGRAVVVVDWRSVQADPFKTWLNTYDAWLSAEHEPRLGNCATIVLGAEGEVRAADLLPLSASDPHLVFHAPSTADTLDFAVEKSLAILHDEIAAKSKSDAIERETQHRTIPGFSTKNAA